MTSQLLQRARVGTMTMRRKRLGMAPPVIEAERPAVYIGG